MSTETQTEVVSPTLADLLRDVMEAATFDVHTAMPARVLSYDASTQSANVQPLLKRTYLNEDDEQGDPIIIPPITNAPVCFPAGGGCSMTWPLRAGDIVLLVFAERSLDRWLAAPSGQEVDPVDTRRHDLSDAIVIPGIRPRTGAIADAATEGLTIQGSPLRLGGPNAAQAAVLGDALNSLLGGFLDAVATACGAGVPPPPVPPPPPAAIAAIGVAATTAKALLSQILSGKVVLE